MYTRCTHCETWFAITADQLRQGHGAVRCGSCLASFDALEALHETLPEDSPDEGAGALEASDWEPEDELPSLDDTGVLTPSDLGEPAQGDEGDEVAPPLDLGPPAPTPLPSLEPGAPPGAAPGADELVDPLDLGAQTTPPTAATQSGDEADDGALDLLDDDAIRADWKRARAEAPETSDTTDQTAGQDEARPGGPRIGDIAELSGRAGESSARIEPSILPGTETRFEAPAAAERAADAPAQPPVATADPGGSVLPQVLLADINRLDRARQQRRRRVLYVVLAAALLVGLIAQYAWFLPGDLVKRYPGMRAWVSGFCASTGCTLPRERQPNLIKLASRDVRIHPQYEGALQVSAAFVNTAALAQPFPNLVFTLYNVNGQAIASRQFTPAQYLGSPPAADDEMLPGQPVQVVLEMLAPEEAAVSFEFRFI